MRFNYVMLRVLFSYLTLTLGPICMLVFALYFHFIYVNTKTYILSKASLFWLYEQGYVLGNPVTCEVKDISQRIPYGHKMALISDELYKVNLQYNLTLIVSLYHLKKK